MRTFVELLGPATGGIRVHVGDLTRRLRAAGRDVTVAGPGDVLPGVGAIDHRVPVPAGLAPLGAVRATAALRRVPGDLVHAHGLKAGWVAVLERRRPVVLTVHNLVIDEAAGRAAAPLRRLEESLMRRVDHLIAPNDAIAARCGAVAPRTPVSVVIPCSPDPVPGRSRQDVRAELGVGDDVPLVVAVARLHPQKDLPTLVRAVARVRDTLPSVRALIVGEGPLHDAMERDLVERGLDDCVRLLGARSDVPDLLGAADVVALSSRWEAIPLVVAEAMLVGRPVVSTDVGIVRRLVTDGENGYVVPVADDSALAEGLLSVLDAADPARLSASARRAAEALVGGDHLAAEVAEVYDRVCSAREPAS